MVAPRSGPAEGARAVLKNLNIVKIFGYQGLNRTCKPLALEKSENVEDFWRAFFRFFENLPRFLKNLLANYISRRDICRTQRFPTHLEPKNVHNKILRLL